MSAILTPYLPILFWLCVLAVFFYAVYRLAKSPTPSQDIALGLAFGGSWEVTAALGIIALAVTAADKWRDELDQAEDGDEEVQDDDDD